MSDDLLIFLGTIPWVIFVWVVFKISVMRDSPKRLRTLLIFSLIFASIRYGIGYDYFSYKHTIEGDLREYSLMRWEPLAQYLAHFCGNVDTQLFFIITSFLSIVPVYYVAKRLSCSPQFTMGLYLLFPMFFLSSLGVIRNGVAYSLSMLTFYFLYKRDFKMTILCYLSSIGFHFSSLMTILLVPFIFVFNKKRYHWLIYIFSFVGVKFIIPLVISFASSSLLAEMFLTRLEGENSGGSIMNILINAIGLFHLFYWDKISKYADINKVYLSYVNIGVCLWNLFLPISQTTALRFSTFFLIYLILLWPSFIYVFRGLFTKRRIMIAVLLIFSSSFILSLYARYINNDKQHMGNIPYQIFFLNPDNRFDYILYDNL